jgi:hypothetical protein
MSAFITEIPVDLEHVKKLLPADTDFEGFNWDHINNKLFMRWGNRKLVTPFSFHMDFPLQLLKDGKLPAQVSNRGEIPVVEKPAEVKHTKAKKK